MSEKGTGSETTQERPTEIATVDWRSRCIEEFQLQPIPSSGEWQEQVARGSEQAWKRYYDHRKRQQQLQQEMQDETSTYWEEDSPDQALWEEWDNELGGEVDEVFHRHPDRDISWWPSHLRLGEMIWEDCDEVRTAEFYAHVWSPYAIPHAIQLKHRYHRRVRYSSMEFYAVWGFYCLTLRLTVNQTPSKMTVNRTPVKNIPTFAPTVSKMNTCEPTLLIRPT
jgi:nicotinamidase-related amidase